MYGQDDVLKVCSNDSTLRHTTPPRATPTNIRIYLYFLKLESSAYMLPLVVYGSIFI